jgi:hypothetical protein
MLKLLQYFSILKGPRSTGRKCTSVEVSQDEQRDVVLSDGKGKESGALEEGLVQNVNCSSIVGIVTAYMLDDRGVTV